METDTPNCRCVCMCVCKYVYVCVYVYARVRDWLCLVHVSTCAPSECRCVCMYVCVWVRACTYVYICACLRACVSLNTTFCTTTAINPYPKSFQCFILSQTITAWFPRLFLTSLLSPPPSFIWCRGVHFQVSCTKISLLTGRYLCRFPHLITQQTR